MDKHSDFHNTSDGGPCSERSGGLSIGLHTDDLSLLTQTAKDLSFSDIAQLHRQRYPLMEPQDYAKLAYQSEFGPEHMITDPQTMERYLHKEWEDVSTGRCDLSLSPESIGNALCRFHLNSDTDTTLAVPLLNQLFCLTAREHTGTQAGLSQKLALLETLEPSVPGMADWLARYRQHGCPAVHHSDTYRRAYAPHYRLLRTDYGGYFPALLAIAKALQDRAALTSGSPSAPLVVAVDGRCGSGKTGFARLAAQIFSCPVLHMDDYYLPLDQRKSDWTQTPAGNMDLERIRREILTPARAGQTVTCRPYCCQTGSYGNETILSTDGVPLIIVEGSYSHHPLLWDLCDLHLFLTCDPRTQAQRLQRREGTYFSVFQSRWIPMEELYLRAFSVQDRADLVIHTDPLFS